MAGSRRRLGIAMSVILAGPCAVAGSAAEPAVVLHIDDRAGVPPRELAAATVIVERTFQAAGVAIIGIEGRFPASITGPNADFPHARHLAVMLVNNGEDSTRGVTGCALGFATPRLAVAYAFYNRIVDWSWKRPVDLTVVLGRVIAHEIGHLLLPPNSHSRFGIMRADLDLGVSNPDRFTDDQARTIRARLVRRAPGD
ncbi:MAG: hypothetical protein ACRD2N_07695 [Vicinamibacterales bacterium]